MYYINLIEKGLGKKANKKFVNFQKGDIQNTHANINKLIRKIKFKPSTSIEKGVKNFCDSINQFLCKLIALIFHTKNIAS